MKKIASAVVAAMVMSSSAVAGVTVYGSIEQTFQSQNSVADVVNGDTYVGFKANEDLGNGFTAVADLGILVDSESATGDAASTRDAYVGIQSATAGVKIGRLINVQGAVGDMSVDVFETNASGIDTDGAGRVNDTVVGNIELGVISLVGSHTTDGSAGDDTQDSYEVGAITDIGVVNGGVAYAKNQNTGTDTWVVGASLPISDLTLGGAWERDETTAGVETESTALTAQYNLGSNVVKVGHKEGDGLNDTLVVEGVHNFSGNTSSFVSVVDQDTTEKLYGVGIRVKF